MSPSEQIQNQDINSKPEPTSSSDNSVANQTSKSQDANSSEPGTTTIISTEGSNSPFVTEVTNRQAPGLTSPTYEDGLASASQAEAEPKNKKKLFIVLGLVLFLIAVVVIALWLWQPWNMSNANNGTDKTGQAVGARTSSDTSSPPVDSTSLNSAYDSFYKNGVVEFIPARKSATLDAYKKLTNGFALNNSFAKDDTNLLMSLGIAYLSGQSQKDFKQYRSEMFLLMSGDLSALPSGINDSQFIPNDDATNQKILAIYKKYKDAALTNRLQQTLATSGVYKAVVASLGLPSAASLKKVHIQVMNFDASDNQQFAKEHSMYGAQPTMWAESIADEPYIFLTKNYAQDFIAKPNGRSKYVVEHEFVHTQHTFARGELGRSVAEVRAEEFSGNHTSYYDVKQMFIYTYVFSGVDLYKIMNKYATDPAGFYQELYGTFGVEMANQIIASWPGAFLNQKVQPVSDSLQLSGGLNGIIKSAIDHGKRDPAGMQKRLGKRVKKLESIYGSKKRTLQKVDNYLNKTYGMPTAAQKVEEYIKTH